MIIANQTNSTLNLTLDKFPTSSDASNSQNDRVGPTPVEMKGWLKLCKSLTAWFASMFLSINCHFVGILKYRSCIYIYVIYSLIFKIVLLIINVVEAYGRCTSWQAVIYSKQPVLSNSDFQDVLFLKHNFLPFICWEPPLAFASMLSGRKHLILLGANPPVQLRLWWWKSQSYWNIYTIDMTLQS